MPRMSLAVFAVGVALIAAMSASASRSELHGRVVFRPTRPVCIDGIPCSRPAAHVVIAFSQRDVRVQRVKTRADGTYRISLPPGVYRVSVPHRRIGNGITPRTIRLAEGRAVRADFAIDTGIQ